MTSTAHIREAQKLAPDAMVELYSLDLTTLNNIYGQAGTGNVYYWCSGTIGGNSVVFNGVTYTPMPIDATGFEWSGQGKLPRPKLRVTNVGGLATGLVVQFGDLLGGRLTRLRTFAKFLDGQPGADSGAVFEADIFRIDRKSAHTKAFIEWELAAEFDQQNMRLPRRQVLRDACSNTYRKWNSTTTAWVMGTCPYAGTPMFDINNVTTADKTKDMCSHRLTGCIARYQPVGSPQANMPFTGFPGVAQTVTSS